jgi:hypothetical protein
MALEQWLGPVALVIIIGVIIFAFRQGEKVKPDPENKPPNINAS